MWGGISIIHVILKRKDTQPTPTPTILLLRTFSPSFLSKFCSCFSFLNRLRPNTHHTTIKPNISTKKSSQRSLNTSVTTAAANPTRLQLPFHNLPITSPKTTQDMPSMPKYFLSSNHDPLSIRKASESQSTWINPTYRRGCAVVGLWDV